MKLGLRCRERMLASVGEGRAEHLLLYNLLCQQIQPDLTILAYRQTIGIAITWEHSTGEVILLGRTQCQLGLTKA